MMLTEVFFCSVISHWSDLCPFPASVTQQDIRKNLHKGGTESNKKFIRGFNSFPHKMCYLEFCLKQLLNLTSENWTVIKLVTNSILWKSPLFYRHWNKQPLLLGNKNIAFRWFVFWTLSLPCLHICFIYLLYIFFNVDSTSRDSDYVHA